MIRCENLNFSYAAGRPVLQHVNLHLEKGSFTFLSGPSGAGKSSLLGVLSLMLEPSSGSVKLFGKSVTKLPREGRVEMRRDIGCVFQDYQLLDHLSVAQNVGLPLKIAGDSNSLIQRKTDELLDWVGLKEYADQMPDELSGGQKQRVAIARAVINNPRIVLADEPTGNLDTSLSMRFMHLFEQLNRQGTTILFATHDDGLISKFSYPTLYIRDKTIQRTGRPE